MSQAIELYKNIEKQYRDLLKDSKSDYDSPELKELEHRMNVVWRNLLTESEKKELLSDAKKELQRQFSQSLNVAFNHFEEYKKKVL